MFLGGDGMFLHLRSKLMYTYDGKDPNFAGHIFFKYIKF